jgi:CRISPR/Cas system CSM-associated protein Csm2 small subunit
MGAAENFVRFGRIIANLTELAFRVSDAVARGEFKRAEELLPRALETSIAKALADDNARAKFGDSGVA